MIICGIIFAAPGFRYCNINLFVFVMVINGGIAAHGIVVVRSCDGT